MDLKNLLTKTRTYRRFYQEEKIDSEILEDLIDNVRLSASAANMQPLKFLLVNQEEMNERIFPWLKWAGYLKEWDGPKQGERPAAYILMLGERKNSPFLNWDYGIALQTILLSATEKGYGACAILAFNKTEVRQLLQIPEDLELGILIALGRPKEEVIIDKVVQGDIKYWRDGQGRHHVPKRDVADLIYRIIQ